MLGELWNFIRTDFKKRLVLCATVVMTLTLFDTFPIMSVKFALFFVLFATSGLFMTVFTFRFMSHLRLLITHRKGYEIPISDEIADLSNRIGVRVKKIRIRKGLCNAYVFGKTLVLGTDLLERLSVDERQAVVAHELGHLKERHALFRFLAMIPFLAVPLYSWSEIHSPIFFTESVTQIMLAIMVNIAFLAYTTTIMIPINWYTEVRADRIATNFVGRESIKSALLALVDKENIDEPSEDHPSISERVKLIEKLEI